MANLLKVKELVKEKNTTLEELSGKIGISPQGLYKLIKGNSTKVDTLEAIAKALDVPVTVFFDMPLNSPSGDNNTVIENSGHGNNFFTPAEKESLNNMIIEKDRRIEELSRQVEFLQNLTNNLMSKTK